jgi:hypothetical protein
MERVCSLIQEVLKFAASASEELDVPRDDKRTGSPPPPLGDPLPRGFPFWREPPPAEWRIRPAKLSERVVADHPLRALFS